VRRAGLSASAELLVVNNCVQLQAILTDCRSRKRVTK